MVRSSNMAAANAQYSGLRRHKYYYQFPACDLHFVHHERRIDFWDLESQGDLMLTIWHWIGKHIFLGPVQSKPINNDQELIQSGPTSCSQNQKGNN